MRFTKNQKRLITDALEERYETLFRAILSLAKNKIVPGEMIKKVRQDLNELQGLKSKFKN